VDVLHGRQQLDAPVDGHRRRRRAIRHGDRVAAAYDDATARATITKAVKTMFPSGRIGA
jgi:hypothetical protein